MQVGDRHQGTFLCHAPGTGRTDAERATRNQSHFAFESVHHDLDGCACTDRLQPARITVGIHPPCRRCDGY
jgi:hypothetical protein